MRVSVRYVLVGLGGLVALSLTVAFGRTILLESQQLPPLSGPTLSVDEGATERLAQAIRYPTVTKRTPSALDSAAYRDLYGFLERAFPRVHRALDTTHVHGLSRLHTWHGTNPALAPIVLMAHVDVVPVEEKTAWSHPPFGGHIKDGYVWGRGALDDKASVTGILEAVSMFLEAGIRPARTIHIAFGHDEEVGGPRGARALANRVLATGPPPALVVDEGGAITKDALPGLNRPLAVVGIAEKGYLSVTLRANAPGGHSSAPPARTSIEILNKALSRLLDDPPPARLDGVMGRTLDYVAPEMALPMRAALANRWLTAPAVRWALSRQPATNAAIRTVQVPTRLKAGVKDNVIPTTATATLNYRILPSHSVDRVLRRVHAATEDLSVQVDTGQVSAPTPVSTIEDSTFRLLQRTIRQVAGDSVIVAPYLVPGATDSRYYADATNHVYRFIPYALTPADRGRIHGVDERIAVEDYRTVIRYYARLLRNADALPRR